VARSTTQRARLCDPGGAQPNSPNLTASPCSQRAPNRKTQTNERSGPFRCLATSHRRAHRFSTCDHLTQVKPRFRALKAPNVVVRSANRTLCLLLPAETNRGQGSQGSTPMPETAPVRRRLPTTAARRDQTGGEPGGTLGGGSTIQRGQLKPHTLTLRTSHFPDPPAPPYNRRTQQLLTQRAPSKRHCPPGSLDRQHAGRGDRLRVGCAG
jgi:hypothetical protein